MSKIEMKNISFAYDGQAKLFENVSQVIDTSWHLGLVGRNGRGKTTLFKLLQNQLPYQGSLTCEVAVQYFPQQVTHPEQTVLTMLEQTVAPEHLWEVEREMQQLGLDVDHIEAQVYQTLSGGEQTKVLLALVFANSDDFILLDEPTNHLDAKTRQQVAQYLQHKQGFIVVSHNRQFLDQTTDHTLSIEKTQLKRYNGSFSVYETEKQARDMHELATKQKLQREIKQLDQAAKQKAGWSDQREKSLTAKPSQVGGKNHGDKGFESARAARTMKKAKQIERHAQQALDDKQALLQDTEFVETLTMAVETPRKAPVVEVHQIQLGYQGQPLFEPASFKVERGDIIGLTGDNGVGKSSLLQALQGTFTGQVTGTVQIAGNPTISQVRQTTQYLHGSLQEFSEANAVDEQALLSMLHKLGLERRAFTLPIEQMSRGQQKRVELAQALVKPAELYLWDEPLNYLDVFNQSQIEKVIRMFEPTMIVVEHDQTFLENIQARCVPLQAVD
ncbi:ABC-F type ribosomal protection protein [Weissella viridescens]|uniref:ABC-F type ribosomal protection protein n=1 Tax=Weissella viridescens TaxID=1629 RepID=A0A3P2RAT7_WEIVI|nr:ATP-binding cassette domain-containing protein [Weissella viridescens]RRG17614.1 ABC-F type ribosomal protection protein [Weissella viridescens]